MAHVDEKQMALARVYSRALLELSEELGSTDELLAELLDLASYLEGDRELEEFLASPLVSVEDRRAILESLFRGRASDLLVDALQVMNRKGRLGILPAVAEGFRREVRDLRGYTDVYVKSAVPLTAGLRERLEQVVSRITGKKPQLVEEVDPALLGGLVIRLGDDKIDTSVARELEKVGDLLQARASREILSGKSYTLEIDAG